MQVSHPPRGDLGPVFAASSRTAVATNASQQPPSQARLTHSRPRTRSRAPTTPRNVPSRKRLTKPLLLWLDDALIPSLPCCVTAPSTNRQHPKKPITIWPRQLDKNDRGPPRLEQVPHHCIKRGFGCAYPRLNPAGLDSCGRHLFCDVLSLTDG